MGQGEMTALAQCLADELDVAYDSVDMIMGDTDLCPWDSGTGGSTCIQLFSPVLRRAGAEARAVLLEMAAEQLHAPVERLKVAAGVVTDPAQDKRITYAQMVQGKRIERHLANVPLKSPSEFRLIGRPQPWKGATDMVTGKTKYTGDISVPGMLCARILRPPVHGATLKEVDTSAAEKLGARVVRTDDGLIAVLHERRDVAGRALHLVKAQYDQPPAGPDDRTIFDHLLKTAPPATLLGEKGNPAEGEKQAAHIVEETYLNSYVAHAPIETHSAMAAFEDGKFTVWASVQWPFPVRQHLADALGVSLESVRVITPVVGGGFGGKSSTPPTGARQALEAARLAKAAGKPVQVVWDRSEEFFYTNYRPAAVVKVRAGLSSRGKDRFLGISRLRRRTPRCHLGLRHSQSAHHFGRQLYGRVASSRHAPVQCRSLARSRSQHQHVRPRIAPRYTRGQGGRGPGGVPPESPDRSALAARARDRVREVRLEAGQGPHRARRRHRLWNLQERKPHGDHGRSGRG